MPADRHRCRWHADGPGGRCPDDPAFPGVSEVPELCIRHLQLLEPWVRARAAQRSADADQWIAYMARQAASTEATLRAIGELPPLRRMHSRPVKLTPRTQATPGAKMPERGERLANPRDAPHIHRTPGTQRK